MMKGLRLTTYERAVLRQFMSVRYIPRNSMSEKVRTTLDCLVDQNLVVQDEVGRYILSDRGSTLVGSWGSDDKRKSDWVEAEVARIRLWRVQEMGAFEEIMTHIDLLSEKKMWDKVRTLLDCIQQRLTYFEAIELFESRGGACAMETE